MEQVNPEFESEYFVPLSLALAPEYFNPKLVRFSQRGSGKPRRVYQGYINSKYRPLENRLRAYAIAGETDLWNDSDLLARYFSLLRPLHVPAIKPSRLDAYRGLIIKEPRESRIWISGSLIVYSHNWSASILVDTKLTYQFKAKQPVWKASGKLKVPKELADFVSRIALPRPIHLEGGPDKPTTKVEEAFMEGYTKGRLKIRTCKDS